MSATTDAVQDGLSEAEIERIASLTNDIMNGETDLATIQGITNEELEAVYALGHGFYGSGAYDDALSMFQFLTLHRHTERRFWFGLAATQQMLGKHALAVQSYGICAALDITDPQVPLRAGECFVALGDTTNARSALEACLTVAGDKPEHRPSAARAKLILANLDRKGAKP